MSNEATVQCGLAISKPSVNLHYSSEPKSFRATVNGSKGPTPGSVVATLAGTDVDLSGLDSPGGLARIMNKATSGFVVVGIHDNFEFYPLLDILPGESYPLRLSRFIGQSVGTTDVGTAIDDAGVYRLRVKSVGVAESEVIIEAFDL